MSVLPKVEMEGLKRRRRESIADSRKRFTPRVFLFFTVAACDLLQLSYQPSEIVGDKPAEF
jgi:hypothetical protein